MQCTIKIGRPIKPERYRDRGAEHIAWRSMIDEVMFEIRELTGQEYRNVYAGKTGRDRADGARRGWPASTDADAHADDRSWCPSAR